MAVAEKHVEAHVPRHDPAEYKRQYRAEGAYRKIRREIKTLELLPYGMSFNQRRKVAMFLALRDAVANGLKRVQEEKA